MSADLPVLEWEPGKNEHYAHLAELGVVTLYAWKNGRWRVDWMDDHNDGAAGSLDDAKAKARQFAKTLLRQVGEQLDRAHDPVTGLIVQVADGEASHG